MPNTRRKPTRHWPSRLAPSSLSGRFFSGLVILLLLALLAIVLTGKLVVLPKLLVHERDHALGELNRLDRVIHTDLHYLATSTQDWAVWDDTYAFIQGKQNDYPERNFSFEMFNDMDYNLMLFFTLDLQLRWVAGIDYLRGNYSSCGDTTQDCAWANPLAGKVREVLSQRPVDNIDHNLEGEPATNFLLVHQGRVFNTAVHSILRTDDTGPSKGWLVQLQLLDEEWVEKISTQTDLPLEFQLNDPHDQVTASIQTISDEEMLARKQLSGTDVSLLIGTTIHRSNFIERLAAMRFSQIWTAGLLVTVILLVLLLLERTVLLPLRQLTRFTRQTREGLNDATLSSTLLERRDEVGELAREFAHLIQQQRMKRTSLENLSRTDHLTKLANRRCFDDKLKTLFGQVEHKTRPAAAILFDVDHFKAYNDRYGHQAGDKCLTMLSDSAQKVVKASALSEALLARIGGEEFAVILPGVEESRALELAEAIRRGIEALVLRHEGTARGFVTISCGLSHLSRISEASSSDLLKTADDALYRAKEGGRNQVVRAAVSPAAQS